MSNVVIRDLAGGNSMLDCNLLQWRPTVDLIRSFNLIDEERLTLLDDGIGEFSQEEAHQLAALFEVNVLPKLDMHDRSLVDSPATECGGKASKSHGDSDTHRTDYSASKAWLTSFFEFCRSSAGIRVY